MFEEYAMVGIKNNLFFNFKIHIFKKKLYKHQTQLVSYSYIFNLNPINLDFWDTVYQKKLTKYHV